MKWRGIATALVASVAVHAVALGAIPGASPAASGAAAALGPCECDYEIQIADGEQSVVALVAPRPR